MDTPSITRLLLLFSLSFFFFLSDARLTPHDLKFLSPAGKSTVANDVTNWAVLVAGSNGYKNYRHQADVCHAYQILKRGGVKDENIIVLMYDDIANNEENPQQGTIINSPNGPDVYNGVPKDYTGNDVTASNLLAVILGDSQAVQGGSGKVVNSSPNDHIFIYYADHGGPGILSMPAGDDLSAQDFVDALTKKHNAGTYARMVIYVEACESGSIFEGLLPQGMNMYVTTAANSEESSYATYCPGHPAVPTQYTTCLGDLYSVSWMEDSDTKDPSQETLEAQYEIVQKRTMGDGSQPGSHVMQYGDNDIGSDVVGLYIGASGTQQDQSSDNTQDSSDVPRVLVDQYEADVIYLREKARRAPKGSKKKAEAERELEKTLAHRKRVDQSFEKIGKDLFGGLEVMKRARPAGQPLVDDWDCLMSMVKTYKRECGPLASYGKKYMRAFANICNAGVQHQANFSQACTITP